MVHDFCFSPGPGLVVEKVENPTYTRSERTCDLVIFHNTDVFTNHNSETLVGLKDVASQLIRRIPRIASIVRDVCPSLLAWKGLRLLVRHPVCAIPFPSYSIDAAAAGFYWRVVVLSRATQVFSPSTFRL
jgi:hypothetical protein